MLRKVERKILIFCIFMLLVNFIVQIQAAYFSTIKKWTGYRDSLYLPRSEFLPIVTLHYDLFFADFLFLRSIQAYGGHFTGDRDYKPVFRYFDVVTDLDPRFASAYRLGNLVIGEEGKNPAKALDLLDKGIFKSLIFNPNVPKYHLLKWKTYQMAHEALFVTMNMMKNPQRAGYYVRMAQKFPDCPDFLKRVEAYIDRETGRYRVAFEKYFHDYCLQFDAGEGWIQSIVDNMQININKWNISVLLTAAQKYKEKFGEDIKDLKQIEGSNILEPYEIYSLEKTMNQVDYLRARGESLLPHFEEILEKSLVTQYGIPREPYGNFYFINAGKTSEDAKFISDATSTIDNLKIFLLRVEMDTKWYKDEYGQYPETLNELYRKKSGEELKQKEPFGGYWVYDNKTGTVRSSTFPDLEPQQVYDDNPPGK